MNSLLRLGISSATSIPTLFSCTGTLCCMVCLAPQLFLPVYLHRNVGLISTPAVALLWVLSLWLPICIPPTGLNECFFFISLVVGLLYISVFCQFWLIFVFKFIVVLLLVVWGDTVYVPTPQYWPEVLWGLTFFEAAFTPSGKGMGLL